MSTYRYLCTNGHLSTAPFPLRRCPAMVKGRACKGELRRIGKGSRTKEAAA